MKSWLNAKAEKAKAEMAKAKATMDLTYTVTSRRLLRLAPGGAQ